MPIFVFGSNKAGRHGKGAALYARQYHGAIYGVGHGIQGNSYGIPTKDENLGVLSLEEIKTYIDEFVKFATVNKNMKFNITKIGCGFAGYTWPQIRPLFPETMPDNCEFI